MIPDDDSIERSAASDQRSRAQRRNDLAVVLGSDAGRSVLYRVLESCGVWRTSFADDPLRTAFAEGRRQVGLMLLSEIAELPGDAHLRLLMHGADMVRRAQHDDQRPTG